MTSSDALVQRASAQAMGTLTAIIGGDFSRKSVNYLLQVLKQTDKTSSKHKDRPATSSGLVAAASISLATHFRIACREEQYSGSKSDMMFDDAFKGGLRAMNIKDMASSAIGSLASRNIREPVRSWSLHAWWLMLRGSTINSKGEGDGIGSKLSFKAAKATMGLVEVHLLVPSVGMPSGRGRDGIYDSAGPDGFDDLIVQEKDGTVVARRLRTKVLLTLGRLVNIVITGLGSRLDYIVYK